MLKVLSKCTAKWTRKLYFVSQKISRKIVKKRKYQRKVIEKKNEQNKSSFIFIY